MGCGVGPSLPSYKGKKHLREVLAARCDWQGTWTDVQVADWQNRTKSKQKRIVARGSWLPGSIRTSNRESQHIAGYAFLFETPWIWIVGHIWFGFLYGISRGHIHNWMRESLGYLTFLCIPAALYSASLWLVLTGIQIVRTRYSVRTHSADHSAASVMSHK